MTYQNLNVESVVDVYPAYVIVRRQKTKAFINGTDLEFTALNVDDKLGLKANGFYREYRPGSVVSYAMKNGDDPLEAVDKARQRNHKLHWINPCSTWLTSHKQDQRTLILVEIGMLVKFEGRLFTVISAPNHNLDFKPHNES